MNGLRYLLVFCALWLVGLQRVCFSVDDHSPLLVTAEIKNVRLHREQARLVVNLLMTVHFKNRSSIPLLLFVSEDWPLQGGQTLASSREDALSNKFIYVSGTWPSSDRPAWAKIRHKLDQKSPPTDLIHAIGPDAEWIFDRPVVLAVEINGSFDKTTKPWDVIKKVDPLWLRLEFMTWPNNLEQDMLNPRFGKRLQQKWKEQGQLILSNISSEPIPLSLPAGPAPSR
jgi:hypothetical protein